MAVVALAQRAGEAGKAGEESEGRADGRGVVGLWFAASPRASMRTQILACDLDSSLRPPRISTPFGLLGHFGHRRKNPTKQGKFLTTPKLPLLPRNSPDYPKNKLKSDMFEKSCKSLFSGLKCEKSKQKTRFFGESKRSFGTKRSQVQILSPRLI
jgi:hypothetical protein